MIWVMVLCVWAQNGVLGKVEMEEKELLGGKERRGGAISLE